MQFNLLKSCVGLSQKRLYLSSANSLRNLASGQQILSQKSYNYGKGSFQGKRLYVSAQAVQAPKKSEMSQKFQEKQDLYGFSLKDYKFVPEYDSHVLLYRHAKTGAEVISVINSDENKTFGVSFKTPVQNSKGIPHILEHSVLCGSRKYPIKEPFVELMKGSMNTFLNAMTFPDRTCYPVASTNLQDYYNLVDVYLDAVYHPRCIKDENVFLQEGWHYELEKPEDDIKYKGVVFNEMKGVYSSPNSQFYRYLFSDLFPSNNYFHDSGGDPQVIPELSYDEFKDFHFNHYHPSNSRIWFYGDDDHEARLKMLDGFLSDFNQIELKDTTVPIQKLEKEPRKVTRQYAAGDTDNPKAFASVNWVLNDQDLDIETEIGLNFLSYLLLGTDASPLAKALNDSELGESQIGGGADDTLRQWVFSVGLKGVESDKVDQVEELVMKELERLAIEGFTDSQIEAALNTTEFSMRENNTGSFPRGLSLMFRSLSNWIYNKDPFEALFWEKPLADFKSKIASDPNLFGGLIQKFLLKNGHKVTLNMVPDKELSKIIEEREQKKLKEFKDKLTKDQLSKIVMTTEELQKLQETPDSPEALQCIPSLKVSDINKEASKIPTYVEEDGKVTFLKHDLFTNNVVYLDMALSLKSIPMRLIPLLPLFTRSLLNMANEKDNFIELTERIDRKTGGISFSPSFLEKRQVREPLGYLFIKGKTMKDKVGDMIDIMRDVLFTCKLDDQARFKQMVLETKSSLEQGVVSAGHRYSASRLHAQNTPGGYISEISGGLEYLHFIRDLAKKVDMDFGSIKQDLETIRKILVNQNGTVVNITADMATSQEVKGQVESFLKGFNQESLNRESWDIVLPRKNEALIVPTQVNYVSKAVNLYQNGYELHGSTYVVEKYLGDTWLWDQVRVMGGAYGGFCQFNAQQGDFTFSSYRDPNLKSSLKAYDGSANYLQNLQVSEDGLTKAIIGTIGEIDSYQLPDAKGKSAMLRYLLGISQEERQKRRDEILNTKPQDFKAFGEVLEVVKSDKANICAVQSQSAYDSEGKDIFNEVYKVI